MVNRGNIYGIFFKSTKLSGSLCFIMISYSEFPVSAYSPPIELL